MKKILLPAILALTLQACAPAVFVAGATAGGAVVYDRRSTQTMWDDKNTSYETQLAMDTDPVLKDRAHIIVAVFNHVMLLTGQAPTQADRAHAAQVAKTVDNRGYIKRVYNEITLAAPTDTARRSKDAWITTKVKTAMLMEKGLSSSQIKVVTENGTVYLMGLVDRTQGDLAADVSRRVKGVGKVVKLFEYAH